MAEPTRLAPEPARGLAIIRERPLEIATGILLVALAVSVLVKRSEGEWNGVYVSAGRKLLAGGDIFEGGYLYPPFMALVAAPLSYLPPYASRAIWFVASAVAMIVMLRAAWRLAHGPAVADIRHWPRRELVAAAVGTLCGMTYILNAFAHQQTDVMIGALMMVGCLRLLAGRNAAGAEWLGIAAACKATPLLWAPYLLLRRRFMAGVLVGTVAVGLNVLPDLVASPPGGGTWLERWVTRFVLPKQQWGTALGTWSSELVYNQSLGGTTQRLINTALEKRDGKVVVVERPRLDPPAVKRGYFVLLGILLAISVTAAARAPPAAAGSAGIPPMAFELGIVMMLMLLMSPMSSPAHFGTLVLPGLCLARVALIDRDRLIGALVAAAAAITALCNLDLVGHTVYMTLLWSGAPTVVTLLLWLGCVLALARIRERAKT
jgi:hypothetical protein